LRVVDSKSAGKLFNDIFSVNDGLGDMLNILGAEGSTSTSFLPRIMVLVPQPYLTRNERRVDVCGMISENTVEYDDGFRYYSSEGEMFYHDGHCNADAVSPCDLVSVIDAQHLHNTQKPISPYYWVHPQYWEMQTWFRPLQQGKVGLGSNTRYLNRMGLVIEITRSSEGANGLIFYDNEDRSYTSEGLRDRTSLSMFDLVSSVRHWDIFTDIDWASDKGISKKAKAEHIPEMFDPTGNARSEIRRRMFHHIVEANLCADQLNMKLGFHMDTETDAD
jgi:hypothetical protein